MADVDIDDRYEYSVDEKDLSDGVRRRRSKWGTYAVTLDTLKRWREYEEDDMREMGGEQQFEYIMVRRLKVGEAEDVDE